MKLQQAITAYNESSDLDVYVNVADTHYITVQIGDPLYETTPLYTERGNIRYFATIETAVNTVRQITGLDSVHVEFEGV